MSLTHGEARGARGRFITFEGGEGTGKSTQAFMLAERLRRLGIDVLLTREPGGTPGAEALRHVILSGAAKSLGVWGEALLFAAARDDHLNEVIRPTLAVGGWVVCDRFSDSTKVYQGVLGNLDPRTLAALDSVVVGESRPDLTVILDIPAELGLKRAQLRRGAATADRFEAELRDVHERMRHAYRALADSEPDRCVLVDAGFTAEEVGRTVWSLVNARLAPGAIPRPAQSFT